LTVIGITGTLECVKSLARQSTAKKVAYKTGKPHTGLGKWKIIKEKEMENKLLSYQEYKKKYKVFFETGVEEAMKEVHGIDADEERENIIRQQYELYLKGDADAVK